MEPSNRIESTGIGTPGAFAGESKHAAGAHGAAQAAAASRWSRLREAIHEPNALTVFRIAVIPILIVLFSFPTRFLALVSALLFSAAAITDYLDGFLARRQGKVTFLGKVLDPVADKLLNASAFVLLASHGWVPAWIVCVIIGRELAVTGLRSVVAAKGLDVSSSRLGKLKTGFQIAAIIPLMIHFPFLGLNSQAIGEVFLWLALGFTAWSGIDYFLKFKRLL